MLWSLLDVSFHIPIIERQGRAGAAMSTKRIFSWSKRQSSPEPYYRTGGLLPIDTHGTGSGNGFEAKVRIDCSRNHDALAERIDVVVQNEANSDALSEACAG